MRATALHAVETTKRKLDEDEDDNDNESPRSREPLQSRWPQCWPQCLSFCSGAWNLRATWGEGAAAAVKPLSPPGCERLVVAAVLKCAA